MEELWKEIPGFEGKYKISSLGQVKSIPRYILMPNGNKKYIDERILKQLKSKDGYMTLKLVAKDFSVKRYRVHRLVALAFLDNPNNYPFVNHKDENKSNNNVDNLEWCTAKYNINYGTGIARRAVQVQRKVAMLDKDTSVVIKIFDSIKEASHFANTSIQAISNVCRNRYGRHTTGGYKWRYADK